MRGHPGLDSPETALAWDDGCGVSDSREDSSTKDLRLPAPATAARIFFSDIFAVEPATLANYGAFDISLVNDLPLFIDPFLLFHSQKPEYQHLHRQIIDYLRFLRDRSATRTTNDADLRLWHRFPEIRDRKSVV